MGSRLKLTLGPVTGLGRSESNNSNKPGMKLTLGLPLLGPRSHSMTAAQVRMPWERTGHARRLELTLESFSWRQSGI